MIESIMYFGIGFFAAGLGVLIVVPLVHSRAVRLTARRLEGTIPSSLTEILAGKDLQRAEFALSTRKLETKLEQLRNKDATQLAELGRKADAINRLRIELDALRDKLRINEENSEGTANAAREAQRALTEKESKLTALTSALEQRYSLAESQKAEIVALMRRVEALQEQFAAADKKTRVAESKLATVTSTLEERSALADSQKADIAALIMRVETLQEQLAAADNKTKTAEEHSNAEHMRLKATNDKLMEEQAKFADFHRRVTELVRRLIAQTRKDELISRRTQDDLKKHLIEPSRLLEESERERAYLRREIEIARTAESEILAAAADIEHRANAVAEKFKLENARLQSALDRAHGERTRLSYELANIKRQAKDSQAA
jgi:hypothetical protein